MIECDDCPYYGTNHHGEGDCFYWTRTRPCDNGNYFIGTWHKYPQEKPPKNGYYFVSQKAVRHGKECDSVFIKMYFLGKGGFYDSSVVAWAELPEPYKEEE